MEAVKLIDSFDKFIDFLLENSFLGYLNYNLLKIFLKSLKIDDIHKKIEEYEIEYREFCKNQLFIDMVNYTSWLSLLVIVCVREI